MPIMLSQNYIYDVVFSLAGKHSSFSQKLKDYLEKKGVTCWIYFDNEAELVGKDQPAFFEELFIKKAKHCIILISDEYIGKEWTSLEKQYILSRSMRDPNYLIPVQMDNAKLPGLSDTIGYISLKNRPPEEIGEIILKRIKDKVAVSAQKQSIRLPKVKKDFDPLEIRNEWIFYTVESLIERSRSVEGMSVSHDEVGGSMHIRVRFSGHPLYSMNIYKKEHTDGDDGISFAVSEGDMRTFGGGVNAMGHFEWSKEKNDVVIELLDLSFLVYFSNDKNQYTKEEFVSALWNKICDILEKNY